LEEVIKLTSFNHEFDRVLMLNLQYDLFDLETLDVLLEVSSFSFNKQNIHHLKSLKQNLCISKGVNNSKWKNLSAKDKIFHFKKYAKLISPCCFGVDLEDSNSDE
jgi:hypothetical protein